MKTRFFMLLAVAAMLLVTATANHAAATTPSQVTYLDFLRAHRQGTGVSLSWSFAVAGVDHYVVERSFDGEFFDPLTEVAAGDRTSRLRDQPPYAGTIYYRVTAVDAAGNALSASTTSVRIMQRG